MEQVEKFIIRILLQNGFTQEEIDSKSKEELKEIYKKGLRNYVRNFSNTQEQQIQKPTNPFLSLQEINEVYNLHLDFFKFFSIEDIVLMFHKRFKHISMERIQKIVKILFFSFQEELLQEIQKKLSNLPKDDQESILNIYEHQKGNIQHLLNINEHLESETFRKKFESILEIKAMIKKQKQE